MNGNFSRRLARKGAFRPARHLGKARARTCSIALWVAAGSGVGGGARLLAGLGAVALFGPGFPYGLLAVNVLGSFLIGLVAALTAPEGRWLVSPSTRHGLMAGFCGGFTTFSFFSLQTLQLIQDGRWVAGLVYVMATVLLSLLGVWSGFAAGVSANRKKRTWVGPQA